MKQYQITIPFAGAVHISIDAENEDEAVSKMREKLSEVNLIDWKELQKVNAECIEADYYENMSQGNVRNYSYDKIDIDCVWDDEADN